MNNFEDTYTFGENSEIEQASESFNFNDISGLGESDYENPDLFETSVDEEVINDSIKTEVEEQPFYIEQPITTLVDEEDDEDEGEEIDLTPFSDTKEEEFKEEVSSEEPSMPTEIFEEPTFIDEAEVEPEPLNEELQNTEEPIEDMELEPVVVDEIEDSEIEIPVEKEKEEEIEEIELEPEIPEEVKEEPILEIEKNDLSKLTEYEEPEIEITDINGLFDKVNVNVKEASDIFRRNTEMKDKIDSRFNELKKLQSEIEKSKQENIAEVDRYKEEVVQKLTDKKNEIEERLNVLKNLQVELENEKKEFESYKKEQTEIMEKTKENIENAYDERKKELTHIEDILRKQKDSLDEQRSQLSLDRIEYEADKNELANNLLKFNELVNSFTSGVNEAKGE